MKPCTKGLKNNISAAAVEGQEFSKFLALRNRETGKAFERRLSVFHLLTYLGLYEGVLIPPLSTLTTTVAWWCVLRPALLGDCIVIESKQKCVLEAILPACWMQSLDVTILMVGCIAQR